MTSNDVTDATSAASSWASREAPENSPPSSNFKGKFNGSGNSSSNNSSSNGGGGKGKEKIGSKLLKKRGGAATSISNAAADIPPPPPSPMKPSPSPSDSKRSLKPSLVATLPSLPVLSPAGAAPGLAAANNITNAANVSNSGISGSGNSANTFPPNPNKDNCNNINPSNSTGTASTATNTTNNPNNKSNTNSNSASSTPPSPTTYPLLVAIEEGTPAAEALKANADVRVSALHKFARSTKSQAVVRALKSAARTASGQPVHSGDRRGAPPFIVASKLTAGGDGVGSSAGSGGPAVHGLGGGLPPETILEAESEDDSQGSGGGGRTSGGRGENIKRVGAGSGEAQISQKFASVVSTTKMEEHGEAPEDIFGGWSGLTHDYEAPDDSINSSEDKHNVGLENLLPDAEVVTMTKPSDTVRSLLLFSSSSDSRNGGMVELGNDYTNNYRPLRQSNIHSSLVAHAALPATIAAACRAGEDMDRQRAESTGIQVMRNSLSNFSSRFMHGHSALSPNHSAVDRKGVEISTTPTATADATAAMASQQGEDEVLERISVLHRHSTGSLKFPSEISCADTEIHANVGADLLNELKNLSDDDNSVIAATMSPREATSSAEGADDLFLKKTRIDPVVVMVPDDQQQKQQQLLEEFPLQEVRTSHEEVEANNQQLLFQQQQQASMRKRKKKSFKNRRKMEEEDETFHFHGPKSVMKWVRRRKSKEQDKKQRSYVKGKVIDGRHELYTMSIAVMLGMRTSIGRTNLQMAETSHNERRWLDNDDLMAVEKYVFRPRGTDITPPHQLSHTFKFKDYSPLAFAYLRRMFGVNEYEFLLSVCGNANYIEFQSNAKSGQFFFYSPDGKYMIKTMTNAESKFLRRILPHYFRHCAMNPNTLVAKFLGMYRVKLYHLRRNVKFMVMKSVYDTDKHLDQLFDVKGSSTGRDAKPGDAVKKDNDVRRSLPDGAFILEPDLRNRLREQVVLDTEWLRAMKIMDYSMLIGVHNIPHKPKVNTSGGDRPIGHRRFGSTTSNRLLSPEDGDERSLASFDASMSHATLDHYLDDDDDGSYLEGAQNTTKSSKQRHANENSSLPDNSSTASRPVDDKSTKKSKIHTDAVLEKAIEDMYWPFHRFYDVQGRRRLNPISESLLSDSKDEKLIDQSEQAESDQIDPPLLKSSTVECCGTGASKMYDVPTFEKPLSNRKDAGFMMDLTDVEVPIKLTKPGAPHIVELCDGKIFYMGIIDILQQFNIRKRFEARYRRMGGKGWEAASCVHPNLYADRFIRFFDEYTQYDPVSVETDAPDDELKSSDVQVEAKQKLE